MAKSPKKKVPVKLSKLMFQVFEETIMAKEPKKKAEREDSEALEKKKAKAAQETEEELDEEEEEEDDEDELDSDLEDEDEDEDDDSDDDEDAVADDDSDDEDDEDAPKKKKAKKAKKEPAAKEPKTKKKAGKVVPIKLVWGVFSNSNQRVAVYAHNQRKDAEEHAKRLMTEKKATFFVQPVKEAMSSDEIEAKRPGTTGKK